MNKLKVHYHRIPEFKNSVGQISRQYNRLVYAQEKKMVEVNCNPHISCVEPIQFF